MVTASPQSAGAAEQTAPEESLDCLRPAWINFWFEPWQYLHPTWQQKLPLPVARAQSDVALLRLGYGEICCSLGISEIWQQAPDSASQDLAVKLITHLPEALVLCRGLWQPYDSSDSERDQEWLRQQRLSAGLHRRFRLPEEDDGETLMALWFLRGLINQDAPCQWQRLRLLLPREAVEAAEDRRWPEQDLSWGLEINQRVARRVGRSLWNHLFTREAVTDGS